MYNWEKEYRKQKTSEGRDKIDFSEEDKRLREIEKQLEQIKRKRKIIVETFENYSLQNKDRQELLEKKVFAMYEEPLLQETTRLENEKNSIKEKIKTQTQKIKARSERLKENSKKIDNILEYKNGLQTKKQEIDIELEIRNLIEEFTKKIETDQILINNSMNMIQEKKKLKDAKGEEEARRIFETSQDNILKNSIRLEKLNRRKRKYRNTDIQDLNSVNRKLLNLINKCDSTCRSMFDGKSFEESIANKFNDTDTEVYIREIAEYGLLDTKRKIKETQYRRAKEIAYEREKAKFGKEYADMSLDFSANTEKSPIEIYALKHYTNEGR